MVQCCVPFCKSTPGPKVPYSFHEFPVTKVRLEWIRRISRRANGPRDQLWMPSDRSKVCSLHFREEDFRRDLKKRRLLPGAVPSIFPGYPAAMQEARRLSPSRESEDKTTGSTPQLLVKSPRPEAPKRRRLSNAMPGASVDIVPVSDEAAHSLGEPEARQLLSGNAAGCTSLKPAKMILRKARTSAQRPRIRAPRKKVLQVTGASSIAELGEGMASFCAPIVPISAEQCTRTSSVPRKYPLQHTSTLCPSSRTGSLEHPTVSAALKVVAALPCSETLLCVTPQSVTTAPDCLVPPSAVDPAMTKHAESQDTSVSLDTACVKVPLKASASTVATQEGLKLTAKAGKQLMSLVDSSTVKEFPSKQKLVPLVVVDAKGGNMKHLMVCSKPSSSNTAAPLAGKLVRVGRLLKRPAAKNKSAMTGSPLKAGWPKTTKHLVLPQHLAAATKQVSQSKPGSAGATRKLLTEKQLESSSSLTNINSFSLAGCIATADGASSSKLLVEDCMALRGELGTPSRPPKRTVGSQTLLTRPRLRHLCQRLKTLQRKCLKLQTQKQQLVQDLSSTRLEARQAQSFIKELRLTQFKERVASGDARCLFLEEQLRCLGQTKHRWREETLQCCLMWHTLSPRGYRIISQSGLLSLPSCSTLKRHVDVVGNGATTRGPPSPTGDTMPSTEDAGDDMLDVESAMADVSKLGFVKTTDNANEPGDTMDDKLGACTRIVVLPNNRNVSDGQHEEGVDHFVKAFASVTHVTESSEDGNQSVCVAGAPVAEVPVAHNSHAKRNGLDAESTDEQAGEHLLEVVYTKPSDILDSVGKVTCVDPDTTVDLKTSTELLPVSVLDQHEISKSTYSGVKGQALDRSGSAGQATNVIPNLRSTVASELPSSASGSSSSVEVVSDCLSPKFDVPCPNSSQKAKSPFSNVGQSVSVVTCPHDQCQQSRPSHAKPASLADRELESSSEMGLLEQVASPPRDLVELLNIVGANVSSTTAASTVDASVAGGVMETETQMLVVPPANLHDKAVEIPFLPVGQSPSVSTRGLPGDEAQALKVIYVDGPAVEGGQCEAISEMVSAALREPGGQATQAFQIFYVCTPVAADQ